MGLLNPLFNAVAGLVQFVSGLEDRLDDPTINGEPAGEVLGQTFEEVSPADEFAEVVVDAIEESILADLQEEGEITPENVEKVADATEGGGVAALLGLGAAGTALEAGTAGQVDQHSEYIAQAVAALGLDSVTGLELDARMSEGVAPAMEAKVSKEHRSQFVALADAVEYALRNKESDEDWLSVSGAPDDVVNKIGSNNQVSNENILEEWGIRDDQLDILEEVSLEAMEFEELIETPAELGLVVDEDTLDEVLDLAGYPETLKDFLRQVPQEIPKTTRTWEERSTTDELMGELDTLVSEEQITVDEALDLIPDEILAIGLPPGVSLEDVRGPVDPEGTHVGEVLRERFERLQAVPAGTPSRTLVEGSFTRGYSGLDEYRDRLDRLEYDSEAFEGSLKAEILDQLDGDLQESVALGLIDENQFSNLAQFVGLDQDATEALLRGESLGDITSRRLKDQRDLSEAPASVIQGIGESRQRALEAAGIETLSDLAQADVDEVAETTNISPETGEEWITQAQQALDQR